jgi:hypothetical protein
LPAAHNPAHAATPPPDISGVYWATT